MVQIDPHILQTLGHERSYVDQPEGLMYDSRPYTTDIRFTGNDKNRLNKAANALYDRLTASAEVQQYIANGTSVLGDGKDRGVISKFRPQAKAKDVTTIMVLLYNLSELASRPTVKLEKGYRNNQYQSVPLNNKVANRDQLSSIIYALSVLDDGWLRIYAGRYNHETGKGLVTRVEPLTPMLDFLVGHRLIPVRLKKKPAKADLSAPVLRVNPKGDDAKAVALSRPLSDTEAVLPLLNRELAEQQIALLWPDYAAYKSYWSYKHHRLKFRSYGRQMLYRQFLKEDGSGGRLYGHFVQQIPSKLRLHLRINRMSVVELDYNAYHLRILAALRGYDLPAGDLYANAFDDRDLFKMVLTNSTGCGTRGKTIESIANRLRKANKTDLATAAALYDTFWSTYPDLCPHQDEGTQAVFSALHGIDSEIALHVLRLLYDAGIYAIPIHDSFIVQARYRDQLEAAMRAAWEFRFPEREIVVV